MAKESAKAAAAFAAYRNLGPSRSLAKVVSSGKVATNLRQLEYWCSQYSWVQRAKSWDEEQRESERLRLLAEEEEKRRKKAAAIEAMNERHAQIGVSLQAKAIKQIEKLIESGRFGSQATVMALKLALDSERLARGEATSIERSEGAVEVRVTYVNDWRENSIDDTPPDAPSWASDSEAASPPLQLAQRRKTVAEDDAGNGNQRRRRSAG